MKNLRQEIQNKVYEVISNVSGNKDIEVNDILMDKGISSLLLVKIIVALETYYNFEFKDSELSTEVLGTVNKITELIEKKIEQMV